MPSVSDAAADYELLWAYVEPTNSRLLLLAALEEFATNGFHASTTREIAERVGMSPAAIYVHYPSKLDMLFEITKSGHKAVLTEAVAGTERFVDPSDRVRAFVETFTAWHARYHTLAHVSQYEIHALDSAQFKQIRRVRRQIVEFLQGELLNGQDLGAFAVVDVRLTVTAILSLGIDVARWYHTEQSPAPAKLGQSYGALVMKMLRRAEA